MYLASPHVQEFRSSSPRGIDRVVMGVWLGWVGSQMNARHLIFRQAVEVDVVGGKIFESHTGERVLLVRHIWKIIYSWQNKSGIKEKWVINLKTIYVVNQHFFLIEKLSISCVLSILSNKKLHGAHHQFCIFLCACGWGWGINNFSV